MRLTFALLGFELDITLGPAGADEATEPDQGAALNGGTLASAGPISFTAPQATPAEWQPPERTLPWEPED